MRGGRGEGGEEVRNIHKGSNRKRKEGRKGGRREGGGREGRRGRGREEE